MKHIVTLPEKENSMYDLGFGGANPKTGEVLGVTNRCFTKNGEPWFPIMGEFHFTRYHKPLWEREILKIKAGGITVVASYIFWIHHEEVAGEFDWTGDRDLQYFLTLLEKHEMKMMLRIGPWAHGEVRNGGFPDWLMQAGCELRSNNPGYLKYVDRLFEQISMQARGHLFKDGGCIIGIQLENEYGHCGGFRGDKGREHMIALKHLAVAKGFVVPYYTATGWGGAVMVEGEMLPVLGAYADAPWDQDVAELPANQNYVFCKAFNDEHIGSDQAMRTSKDLTFTPANHPYATAELGGGIQVTKHRRPIVTALDTQAMIFTRFGSGSNLLGYYMYHGGTNPKGRLTTLQESYASGGYNDLPILSYDFQAVLGEYGEPHPSYRYLKILHTMINDFGHQFADALCHIPGDSASKPEDLESLRYAILKSGTMGLICLNNHQRHRRLHHHKDIDITVGDTRFPLFDLNEGESIAYPFAWQTDGIHIGFATGQPLCRIEEGNDVSLFFWNYRQAMAMELDGETIQIRHHKRHTVQTAAGKRVHMVLLSREQAENAWKVNVDGREKLLITPAALVNPAEKVILYGLQSDTDVLMYQVQSENLFTQRTVTLSTDAWNQAVPFKRIDANTYDFTLPKLCQYADEVFLCIDFDGNIANLYADGERVADWFYTGLAWRVGLKKFSERHVKEWTLDIEPLLENERIYLEKHPQYIDGVASCLRGMHLECCCQATL